MIDLGLLALAFGGGVCVLVAAVGLHMLRSVPAIPATYASAEPAPRPRRRLTDQGGPTSVLFELIGRPFEGPLLRAYSDERLARVRKRIGAAGLTDSLPISTYMRRRAGSAVLLGALGLVMLLSGQAFFGLLLLVVGYGWTDGLLLISARRRREQIERALPDFLDILAVTVSGGLGFRRALERVCEHTTGPLAEEFRTALHQMDLGTSRREAFQRLRERSNAPTLSQFVTAILQAEELGAPLAKALIDISVDMRGDAAQYTRQRAERTAPRIQLVIAMIMVPGALLLLFGAFIVAWREGGFGVLG